jgi:hypothetical protein
VDSVSDDMEYTENAIDNMILEFSGDDDDDEEEVDSDDDMEYTEDAIDNISLHA